MLTEKPFYLVYILIIFIFTLCLFALKPINTRMYKISIINKTDSTIVLKDLGVFDKARSYQQDSLSLFDILDHSYNNETYNNLIKKNLDLPKYSQFIIAKPGMFLLYNILTALLLLGVMIIAVITVTNLIIFIASFETIKKI